MKHLYYKIACNLIWYMKKVKLMVKYHTLDTNDLYPSDYEDLSNF